MSAVVHTGADRLAYIARRNAAFAKGTPLPRWAIHQHICSPGNPAGEFSDQAIIVGDDLAAVTAASRALPATSRQLFEQCGELFFRSDMETE